MPTQLPTLSGTGNEYRPVRYALRLGVKQVWLIPLVDKRVGVAGKTVPSLVNTCHIQAPRR